MDVFFCFPRIEVSGHRGTASRRRLTLLASRDSRDPEPQLRCKVGPLQELPELPRATDRPRKVVERLFRSRRGRLLIRVQRDCLNQLQTLTPGAALVSADETEAYQHG